MENKEIVICAAIKIGEKVWRGHRHSDAIGAMNNEMSWDYSRKQLSGTQFEQGFVTSYNRFVSREEARKLQDASGIESVADEGYMRGTLFSEDLY